MTEEDALHVIEQLGGDGRGRRQGDNLMVPCVHAPWTHDSGEDSSQKLGLKLSNTPVLAHCFRPGCFSGTLGQLVSTVGPKRVAEGLMTFEDLAQLNAFVILAEEGDDVRRVEAPKTLRPLPGELVAAVGDGCDYWHQRGVTLETQRRVGMGEWGGRAWLTVARDAHGLPVAVQGRLLPGHEEDADGHGEKHRTLPAGFVKGQALCGATGSRWPLCVVVESPVDAILLTQWMQADPDFPEGARAVATMGGESTAAQVTLLVEAMDPAGELVLAYDRDPAGRLGQQKLYDQVGKRVRRVSEVAWEGKDPSDDDSGRLGLDEVKARAIAALGKRESAVVLRLKRMMDRS